ncbi:Proprotein convertase subtilisin/kexin type 6 [Labeo rohita]|uniref:Proprotein convertase subtilisin/kexin type 6 n=1 Tax=Labeo rohita TaxID=84645 RepID=A0ABQ8MJW3_LABRO|nr:Proprotein convertase subtilisin/kexin type 6 [Labeo rohita]
MTVHCWGERAEGTWTLEISDSPSQLRNPEVLGKLKEWTLILHGTAEHPYQSQGSQHSRSRMLEIPTAGKELKNPDSVLVILNVEIRAATGRMQITASTAFTSVLAASRPAGRVLVTVRWVILRTERPADVAAVTEAVRSQRRCQKCHENCWKCLRDADRCTACKDGFSLDQPTVKKPAELFSQTHIKPRLGLRNHWSRTGGVHSVCAGLLTAGVAVRPNLRPRILQRRGCGIRTEDVPQPLFIHPIEIAVAGIVALQIEAFMKVTDGDCSRDGFFSKSS